MAKAKQESGILNRVKIAACIIVSLITISAAAFGVERYFAKAGVVKTVDAESKNRDRLITERLEISIIDDQIFQQQQTVQRFTDWRRFEQRAVEPELTPIEKTTLEKAEKRLLELEKKKEEKIKHYENGHTE